MTDPTCAKLRKAARLIQENMIDLSNQLPNVYGYRAAQAQAVEQITCLVEAYERRIAELLVPLDLPPVDIKHGGYEN